MADRGRPRRFDRENALKSAMVLFWKKGYAGASLSDLTAAMGINSPSLYAAFGSKEALFREALALYGKSESGEIWEPIVTGRTAREAIAGFLHGTAISFTRPGKPAGCLVVLGALHADDAGEAVCGALRDKRVENVAEISERLKRAIAEGELPPSIDCDAIASFYVTVQQGMSIQARDGASRETLLAIADGAMAAWDRLTTAEST
ncbi:TetR/AcrR family transcriptional regulator [Aquamicrobium sp. LC103]|uniref:TetR/AcrR family transcriptional regulator n=1 Tax=Aquamicrobium sp. LC103 TaxID=1120658 RepID=UPI00063E86FF|nr:TetR/AcrR family transcriptional regulator [Aquamicrobium sp. LC103]TKT80070.1 TetR/AcrR family transcriptional regulator [Aquamicrobium sp. LC103]